MPSFCSRAAPLSISSGRVLAVSTMRLCCAQKHLACVPRSAFRLGILEASASSLKRLSGTIWNPAQQQKRWPLPSESRCHG